MFGYVKPYVPELKVKENEFYRATYCGLCRALGRKSRFLSFTLSYDFVSRYGGHARTQRRTRKRALHGASAAQKSVSERERLS